MKDLTVRCRNWVSQALSSARNAASSAGRKRAVTLFIFGVMAVMIGGSIGFNSSGGNSHGYAYAQSSSALPEGQSSGLMILAQDDGDTTEDLSTADPDSASGSGNSNSSSGSSSSGSSDLTESDGGDTEYDFNAGWNKAIPATESVMTGNSPRDRAQSVLGTSEGEETAYGAIQRATDYLPFSRWTMDGVILPSVMDFNSVTSGLMDTIVMFISKCFYILAGVVFMVIGWAIASTMSISFVGVAAYKADQIFSDVAGTTLYSGSVDANEVLKFLLIGIVALVGWRLFKRLSKNQESNGSVIAPIGWLVGAVLAIAFVGHQSAKNHPDSKYVTASDQLSPIGKANGDSQGVGNSIDDPGQWSKFSVGWAVAQVNVAAKSFSGVVNNVNSLLFQSLNAGLNGSGRPAPTECDLYVKGLQATYQSTPAANTLDRGGLLVNYDNFVNSTLFDLYKSGVWGDSEGAGGTWCRAMESEADIQPAEQIMVSRAAGLYPELIGQGGLGLVAKGTGGKVGGETGSDVVDVDAKRPTNYIVDPFSTFSPGYNGREANVAGGTLVAGDGTWVNQTQNNVKAASNYFGPNYPSVAGAYSARFYFAGCMWEQGQPAKLRPEWDGVVRAGGDSKLTDASCTDMITSGSEEKGGFGWIRDSSDKSSDTADMAWNYSPMTDNVKPKDKHEDDSAGMKVLNAVTFGISNKVRDGIDGARAAVSNVAGGKVDTTGITERMQNAYSPTTERVPASSAAYGNTGAYHTKLKGNMPQDLFNHISGSKGISTLVFAALAGGFALKMFKPLAGIVVGALGAQIIGAAILVAMALFFILLFIPAKQIRDLFKTGLLVVVSSFFVTVLLQILLSTIVLLGNVLLSLFGADQYVGLMKAGLTVLVYYFTFAGALAIVNKLFNINLRDFRDTAKVLAMAGSPALNKMGANVANPLDFMNDRIRRGYRKIRGRARGPWWDRRGDRDALDALDKNSSRNARRKAAEERRRQKARQNVTNQKLNRDLNAARNGKRKTGTRKGKIGQFLNSRLARNLTDSKLSKLSRFVPVVGQYTAAAAAGVAGARKAYNLGSKFKGASSRGLEKLRGLKGRYMSERQNGSNAGDMDVNSVMGDAAGNENNYEYSYFRTPDKDYATRTMLSSAFNWLNPGVLRSMVSNMTGLKSSAASAVGAEDWVKNYQEAAKNIPGLDFTTDSGVLPGVLQSVSPEDSVRERSAAEPTRMLDRINKLLADSQQKEADRRAAEQAERDRLPAAEEVFSQYQSQYGHRDAAGREAQRIPVNPGQAVADAMENGEAVATAVGSDYPVAPVRVDAADAVQNGSQVAPGSVDEHGRGVLTPQYDVMGVAQVRQAVEGLTDAVDRNTVAQGDYARDVRSSQESVARSVMDQSADVLGRAFSAGGSSVSQAAGAVGLDSLLSEMRSGNMVMGEAVRRLDALRDTVESSGRGSVESRQVADSIRQVVDRLSGIPDAGLVDQDVRQAGDVQVVPGNIPSSAGRAAEAAETLEEMFGNR